MKISYRLTNDELKQIARMQSSFSLRKASFIYGLAAFLGLVFCCLRTNQFGLAVYVLMHASIVGLFIYFFRRHTATFENQETEVEFNPVYFGYSQLGVHNRTCWSRITSFQIANGFWLLDSFGMQVGRIPICHLPPEQIDELEIQIRSWVESSEAPSEKAILAGLSLEPEQMRLDYRLTREDLTRAAQEVITIKSGDSAKSRQSRPNWIAFAIMLVIVCIVVVGQRMDVDSDALVVALSAFVLSLLVASLPIVLLRKLAMRAMVGRLEDELFDIDSTLIWGKDGVALATPWGATWIEWSGLSQAIEADSSVRLWRKDRLMNVIPKRYFVDQKQAQSFVLGVNLAIDEAATAHFDRDRGESIGDGANPYQSPRV